LIVCNQIHHKNNCISFIGNVFSVILWSENNYTSVLVLLWLF
jgi:hypothetical protein